MPMMSRRMKGDWMADALEQNSAFSHFNKSERASVFGPGEDVSDYMGAAAESARPIMSYADYMDQNPTSMQPKAVGGGFWGFLGRGAAAKYGRDVQSFNANMQVADQYVFPVLDYLNEQFFIPLGPTDELGYLGRAGLEAFTGMRVAVGLSRGVSVATTGVEVLSPEERMVQQVVEQGLKQASEYEAGSGLAVPPKGILPKVGVLGGGSGRPLVGEKTAPRFKLGPVNPDDVNATFVDRGMRPPYAASVQPRVIQLRNPKVLARVHGEANQARSWMMRPKEIEGLTPEQIKTKFALPELPKYVSEVHLPSGSYMRLGRVAAQEGWGVGGAMQYESLDWLDEEVFQNMRELQPEITTRLGL